MLCSSDMVFHEIFDDVMADDVWAHNPRDKNNERHFPKCTCLSS